ncbi:hypothetical protein X758_14715 [Mesorhizobium sp. LSHC416B00]|nr:hypothetical protein X758_14715 [Mesorhizobium sp. LSHC416B00]
MGNNVQNIKEHVITASPDTMMGDATHVKMLRRIGMASPVKDLSSLKMAAHKRPCWHYGQTQRVFLSQRRQDCVAIVGMRTSSAESQRHQPRQILAIPAVVGFDCGHVHSGAGSVALPAFFKAFPLASYLANEAMK